MKKFFEEPEVQVVNFNAEDIITTSDPVGGDPVEGGDGTPIL